MLTKTNNFRIADIIKKGCIKCNPFLFPKIKQSFLIKINRRSIFASRYEFECFAGEVFIIPLPKKIGGAGLYSPNQDISKKPERQ